MHEDSSRMDFTDSGLSSPQACLIGREQTLQHLLDLRVPRSIAVRVVSRDLRMTLRCDADDCTAQGRTNGHLDAGTWRRSEGWRHHADLDFCPDCWASGAAASAVAAGVRPRGA